MPALCKACFPTPQKSKVRFVLFLLSFPGTMFASLLYTVTLAFVLTSGTASSGASSHHASTLARRAPAQVITSCMVKNTAALTFVGIFYLCRVLSSLINPFRTTAHGFICKYLACFRRIGRFAHVTVQVRCQQNPSSCRRQRNVFL